MEHRPVIAADVGRAASDNLVDTYFQLGGTTPGSKMLQEDGFRACIASVDHPIGNFAASLNLDPWSGRALAELAASRPCFHVYSLPSDHPGHRDELLERVGFKETYRLIQMVAEPREKFGDVEFSVCEAPDDRLSTARFMVEQFFSRQTPTFRQRVADATAAASGLELLEYVVNGKTAAAVMLCDRPGMLGLYNLCVAPARRGEGLGGRLVEAVMTRAQATGTCVTLQCAGSLEAWYSAKGFRKVGLVQVYTLARSNSVAIME